MNKIKFFLTGVSVLTALLLLFCAVGPRMFSMPGAAGETWSAAVPAAGDVSWLWLGIALIVCAVGIIILVLSKHRGK